MRSALPDVKGAGRIVRGYVSASGGIIAGSGYLVAKTGTGLYVVTFPIPFKGTPIVVAGSASGANGNQNAPDVYEESASQFQVQTGANPGGNADKSFTFYAMEANPA